MIRTIIILSACLVSTGAVALQEDAHDGNKHDQMMHHQDDSHDHESHDHSSHDHKTQHQSKEATATISSKEPGSSKKPGHTQAAEKTDADDQENNAGLDNSGLDNAALADDDPLLLIHTPEIDAALETGGAPVVVKVLGVVCDFCAKAMNKTFGKKDAVLATYVDLDTKTLNLVLVSDDAMSDEQIEKLVVRSGYRAALIDRGAHLLSEE